MNYLILSDKTLLVCPAHTQFTSHLFFAVMLLL